MVPPPGFKPAEGVTRRLLKRVDFHLIVTDKETAFGLLFSDGKMDYAQFVSKDDRFRGWCHDLFHTAVRGLSLSLGRCPKCLMIRVMVLNARITK